MVHRVALSIVILFFPACGATFLRGRGSMSAQTQFAVQSSKNASGGGVFYDGYSLVTCEVDASPQSERIYFKEHACGGLPSCRLEELPMQPRLCFDFCRQYQSAKFFGIAHGTDCYCAGYFHPASTGGQGECSFHCEGDTTQMCGGPSKSSLFEMHMCGDSASEADLAMQVVAKAAGASQSALANASATILKLRNLSNSWTPGVCSMQPEGGRVCALPGVWNSLANSLADAASKVSHAQNVTLTASQELEVAKQFATTNAADVTAASNMELLTGPLKDSAYKLQGLTATLELTLGGVGGPFVDDKPMANFHGVFSTLGDNASGWHAICALAPVVGATYAATAADSPTTCGSHCLSKSTGTGACVAFNYQYKDGLASCQLLTEEGLVKPRLNMAVPIFEVSSSKMTAMGIQSMGCYAHGAFLAGHPRGPLAAEVLGEITA